MLIDKPLFYYRYVDDIILAAHADSIDNLHMVFNSFHERLQFIMDVYKDNHISFLDVNFVIDKDKIICI